MDWRTQTDIYSKRGICIQLVRPLEDATSLNSKQSLFLHLDDGFGIVRRQHMHGSWELHAFMRTLPRRWVG